MDGLGCTIYSNVVLNNMDSLVLIKRASHSASEADAITSLMSYKMVIIAPLLLLLGDPKYGPGFEPHWKAGSARYLAFYKALLEETSITKRIQMVRACTREYL